jgi:hypothetical protein
MVFKSHHGRCVGSSEATEHVSFNLVVVRVPGCILANRGSTTGSRFRKLTRCSFRRFWTDIDPEIVSFKAFLAIAQGNAPKEATVKILEYKEMAGTARSSRRTHSYVGDAIENSDRERPISGR